MFCTHYKYIILGLHGRMCRDLAEDFFGISDCILVEVKPVTGTGRFSLQKLIEFDICTDIFDPLADLWIIFGNYFQKTDDPDGIQAILLPVPPTKKRKV